jgi:predicted AAA+ superfamily ATPase
MDTVIHRDIEERYDIGHSLLLKELLRHCLQNAASPMSLHKLYQRFKSLGRSVSKDSLYAFMEYFQDAYCLFSVPVYSHSLHQRNLLPKKIYCADSGLITAYTIKPETEESARLENAVFCELRRQTQEIYYYKTRDGREVDFITLAPDGRKELYQVCVTLGKEETFTRETESLVAALAETGLSSGTVVTLDEEKDLLMGGKRLRCIPVGQWFLRRGRPSGRPLGRA